MANASNDGLEIIEILGCRVDQSEWVTGCYGFKRAPVLGLRDGNDPPLIIHGVCSLGTVPGVSL